MTVALVALELGVTPEQVRRMSLADFTAVQDVLKQRADAIEEAKGGG